MTGQAPPDALNPAMLRGQRYEDEACFAFMQKHGGFYEPKCIEHPDIPWAAASLDGLSLIADAILEIKVPGAEVLSMAMNGIVPSYYYAQIQWQLLCCPIATKASFWAYNPDTKQGHRVSVLPDPAFQQMLLQQCTIFRECVLTRQTPAGNAWLAAAIRWRSLKQQIAEDQKNLEAIEQELAELMPPALKRHEGGGVSITRVKTQTKVSWPEFLATRGLTALDLVKQYMQANQIPEGELDKFRSLDLDAFLASRQTQISILGELYLLQQGVDPDELAPFVKTANPRFSIRAISMEDLRITDNSNISLGCNW